MWLLHLYTPEGNSDRLCPADYYEESNILLHLWSLLCCACTVWCCRDVHTVGYYTVHAQLSPSLQLCTVVHNQRWNWAGEQDDQNPHIKHGISPHSLTVMSLWYSNNETFQAKYGYIWNIKWESKLLCCPCTSQRYCIMSLWSFCQCWKTWESFV